MQRARTRHRHGLEDHLRAVAVMCADVDDRYPLRADGAQRLRRDRPVVEITGAYESCKRPASA